MIEWVRQRHSKGVPLAGPMLMAQAKLFREGMNLNTECTYSTGWLTKFKNRHGIRQKFQVKKIQLILEQMNSLNSLQVNNYLQNKFTTLMKLVFSVNMYHEIPRQPLQKRVQLMSKGPSLDTVEMEERVVFCDLLDRERVWCH
ncbi:Jerky protein-like protein, partial [Stegodyphus mimosarum]